jgi:acylpyruvate hydrolase
LTKADEETAMQSIGGYCTALDFTCKEALLSARDRGLSWAMSKSFDTACAVGDFISKEKLPDPGDVNLWLTLNGEMKQKGHSSDMVWSAPTLLSIISQYLTLEPGDLVLTGTPGGIGTISPGDVIKAGIEDVDEVMFEVE